MTNLGRILSNTFSNKSNFAVFSILVVLCLLLNAVAVAQSAEQPAIAQKPVALKVLEMGKVPNRTFKRTMAHFWQSYDRMMQLYFINYGTDKEIARRERLIINYMPRLGDFDRPRITFVRGGFGNGPNTVIWKIPPSADYPAQ